MIGDPGNQTKNSIMFIEKERRCDDIFANSLRIHDNFNLIRHNKRGTFIGKDFFRGPEKKENVSTPEIGLWDCRNSGWIVWWPYHVGVSFDGIEIMDYPSTCCKFQVLTLGHWHCNPDFLPQVR